MPKLRSCRSFERVPLLVADEDDASAAQGAQPAHDGLVVAAQPVAAQLDEVGQHVGDVVEGLRPVLVARELDRLPGAGASRVAQRLEPLLDPLDLLGIAVREAGRLRSS